LITQTTLETSLLFRRVCTTKVAMYFNLML